MANKRYSRQEIEEDEVQQEEAVEAEAPTEDNEEETFKKRYGDLRRHMGDQLLKSKTSQVMTNKPKSVTPATLASAALEMMNASRITALFVVDKGKPAGIVHVHDMLRAGVV